MSFNVSWIKITVSGRYSKFTVKSDTEDFVSSLQVPLTGKSPHREQRNHDHGAELSPNRIVSTLQSQRYILAHLGVQRRTKLFRLRNAVEPTTGPRSRIFIDSVICQSIYSHCFDCRFRYLCTIRNLSCELLKDRL